MHGDPTGLTMFARTGELFQAKAGDFVFDHRLRKGVWSLPLTKSGQRAGVRESLTIEDQWLLVALKNYCKSLHPGDTLRKASPQLMRNRFKELLQEANLPPGFAFYSLRRGGATHAYRQSNNLSWVCLVGRWGHEKTARILHHWCLGTADRHWSPPPCSSKTFAPGSTSSSRISVR